MARSAVYFDASIWISLIVLREPIQRLAFAELDAPDHLLEFGPVLLELLGLGGGQGSVLRPELAQEQG